MPDVTLRPGDRLPSNLSNCRVLLPDGEYKPSVLRSVPGVTFAALNPRKAVLVGGTAVPGEDDPATCRVLDGSPGIAFEGLVFRGSPGHGVRITGCPRVRLSNCLSERHRIEAFILGACDDALVEDCEGAFCQGDDRSHCLYISYGTQRPVVRRFYGHDCTGSAQWNGKTGPMEGVSTEGLHLARMGSGGTLALSLMGVVGGNFANLLFEACNRQEEGLLGVLFADGNSGPCRRVTLKNFSPTSGRFRLEDKSTAVVEPGSGWQPGTPPAPPPAPRDAVGEILAKWAAAKSDGQLLDLCRAGDLRLVIAELRRLRGAA